MIINLESYRAAQADEELRDQMQAFAERENAARRAIDNPKVMHKYSHELAVELAATLYSVTDHEWRRTGELLRRYNAAVPAKHRRTKAWAADYLRRMADDGDLESTMSTWRAEGRSWRRPPAREEA